MQIYLIRHAHAVDATEDQKRPLSAQGRKQVKRLARFLCEKELLDTDECWHSPLARSVETAKLLADGLHQSVRLVEVDGLQGDDDPAIMAERLKTRRHPVALVGHEPHLSALASLLVAGVSEPPRFVFKKSGAVALERREGVWAVCWQTTPQLVR